MQVLAVTPEIFPLVKTGGLADVTGALPIALAAQGVTVRTLVPGYPVVMSAFKKRKALHQYDNLQGGKASVYSAQLSGLDLFVLDAPHLFDRAGGLYGDATGADWPDNWRRFAALSQVGGDIAGGAVADYLPAIVHAHDWQAALTLAYMRYGRAVGTPSVMTVHNLAFQGQFGAGIFGSRQGVGGCLHMQSFEGEFS
jgi:starch synthase